MGKRLQLDKGVVGPHDANILPRAGIAQPITQHQQPVVRVSEHEVRALPRAESQARPVHVLDGAGDPNPNPNPKP